MQNKAQIFLLYAQSLILGFQLTMLASAGNYLTSIEGHQFTTEQYSSLFLPMIFAGILAAFFGGMLAQRTSNKLVLLSGVVLNALSLACFILSDFHTNSYLVLLIAMCFFGAGFGSVMTAINPLIVHYFPKKSGIALTASQACIGIGMAASPLLTNFSLSLDAWWIAPLTILLANLILFVFGKMLLPQKNDAKSTQGFFTRGLIIFAFIALLYGLVESTFANWAAIYLRSERGFSRANANDVLFIFWACVTIGRILTTFLLTMSSPRLVFRSLPFLILIALALIQLKDQPMIAFGLAGLGCSALFPLTISFTEKRFPKNASFSSGLLIAGNQIGYGITMIAGGMLHQKVGISLHQIYLGLGLFVIALGSLCFVVTSNKTT